MMPQCISEPERRRSESCSGCCAVDAVCHLNNGESTRMRQSNVSLKNCYRWIRMHPKSLQALHYVIGDGEHGSSKIRAPSTSPPKQFGPQLLRSMELYFRNFHHEANKTHTIKFTFRHLWTQIDPWLTAILIPGHPGGTPHS